VVLSAAERGRPSGEAILEECRTMLGYPYDRGGSLLGRAPEGHPSHSWQTRDEGWHVSWGDDRRDNDGDGETDEADEHFIVCSDLLVEALRRHGVDLLPLMAKDYRASKGKDYTKEGPVRSQEFFPRRVKNLVSYFKHSGKTVARGAKESKRYASFKAGDILFCHTHMGIVSAVAAGRPSGVIHVSFRLGRAMEQPVFWQVSNWWYENTIAVGRW